MTDHAQSHHQADAIPPRAIQAAGALVLAVLIAVAAARLFGWHQDIAPHGSLLASRMLRFEDRADGGITIIDATSRQIVEQIAPVVSDGPNANGFLRGALRGLARERREAGFGAIEPFQLESWSDGRLTLTDPATHITVELTGFGQTNAATFARLLTSNPDAGGNPS